MTVAVPTIGTWDGEARRAYLLPGVGDYSPIEDLYHEYRNQRRLDENLRKYEPLLKAEGNVPKGAGAFTPRYVVLLDGFKVVPYDNSTQVNQLGDMITDDPDSDPTLYDISGLTVPKVIFIKPSESEIIQLNSAAIEFSEFANGVFIKAGSGHSGTTGSIGSQRLPVDNVPDGVTIADTRGVNTVNFRGDYTLTAGDDLDDFIIKGQDQLHSTITVEPGANVFMSIFNNCTLTGLLDGGNVITDSRIGELDYVDGEIRNCLLTDATLTLGGGKVAQILDCRSGIGIANINMGGAGQSLNCVGHKGDIGIFNLTDPTQVIEIVIDGHVLIDSSITEGSVKLVGLGTYTNNAGPNVIFNDIGFVNQVTIGDVVEEKAEYIATVVWSAVMDDNDTTGSFGWAVKTGRFWTNTLRDLL